MIDWYPIADAESDKGELDEVVMREGGAIARAAEQRMLKDTCRYNNKTHTYIQPEATSAVESLLIVGTFGKAKSVRINNGNTV